MGNAFLDAELLRFVAAIPAAELGEGQDGGEDDEDECGVTSGWCAPSIGGFRFCYGGELAEVSLEVSRRICD